MGCNICLTNLQKIHLFNNVEIIAREKAINLIVFKGYDFHYTNKIKYKINLYIK